MTAIGSQRNCAWPALVFVLFALGSLLGRPDLSRAGHPMAEIPRVDGKGIDGALVIAGGGRLPRSVFKQFRRRAGRQGAKLVVIPTASARADRDGDAESWVELWNKRGFDDVEVLHTRDRDQANDPDFLHPLREATAVWFGGGAQSRIADAYLGTALESELEALLKRGGVIGGTSAGAAIMSRVMIAGGNPNARLGEGFDLLPGCVVDQHFVARNREPRLRGVIEARPGLVGIGIDEGTALVVQGRDLDVIGDSSVTVILGASSTRPVKEIELRPGQFADLTALRRAARDRTLPAFPPEEMGRPKVEAGALMIVGGGGLSREMMRRFIELAGGPEALIVVVPTAEPGPVATDSSRVAGVSAFTRAGAKNVQVLRGRTQEEVETQEQMEMLKQAGGIWFGGGRQWRFVDAYEGTSVVDLFHDVLRRGGVIGGSSAGATIQGDYLVRGNPLGNIDMMADGYERGFAFLPGVAIDQHFTQRNRFADLSKVVDRFPQVLGLGIDETTALIVQGSVSEVIGDGAVHVFDRRKPVIEGHPDFETIPSGGRYDLQTRTPLGSHSTNDDEVSQ